MDCQDYITGPAERKKGQHLQREERGAIQHLKCQGYTNRAIAREIGCSPSTVANELRRGTPPRKSNKGRKPGYSARHGEAVYKANRKHSRKHHRICRCAHFLRWTVKQFKEHKWSLDACVGYARLHGLFPADEMVCTRTLYNEVWAGNLDLSVTELPEAMKRKQHKDSKPREHKKSFGTDISQRPEIAALRIEEGHWEGDTVVGKRAGKEAVVLSLLEKKTENYIAIQIPGKDADSVLNAMHRSGRNSETSSHRSSRPLPWTTARSSLRSVWSRTGAVQSTLHIPILRGNVPKTSATTACFGLLCPRVPPLNPSLQSTSCLLLMS